MDGDGLRALADRVEAATGADRDIDLEIARLFRVTVWKRNDDDTENYETTHWRYTASIDAAMSLVPEGYKVIEFEQDSAHDWSWWCWIAKSGAGEGSGQNYSPALALTAAALRARADEIGRVG